MSTPEGNWGELFYDHYARRFGPPAAREVFEPHTPGATIQVLSFDKVFPRCTVYGTVGLTHYAPEIGLVAEVLLCSDPGHKRLPYILASTLFYIVQARMQFGWGIVIGGIDTIAPDFVAETGKSALYFSLPSIFPPEVREIAAPQGPGRLFLATPISPAEHRLFSASGARELEKTLAESGLDPLLLHRGSSV